MSALQKTEQVVSQSARIVKRGDTYVLVDVNVMFPDGVWDMIKSYAIPKKIHPADKIEGKQIQFREAISKWKKQHLVKMINKWWSNQLTEKWANTKSSQYKNTPTKTMIDEWCKYGLFGNNLNYLAKVWSNKRKKFVNKKTTEITEDKYEQLKDTYNMVCGVIETADYKKEFADYLLD